MAVMTMSVTLKDIAERVGVSVSSVSRVLNGLPGVSPAVRDEIRRASEELGYVGGHRGRHSIARETIGLLIPNVTNPFFADILKGVLDGTRRFGCALVVEDAGDRADLESTFLTRVAEQDLSGLIYMTTSGHGVDLTSRLNGVSLPVVAIDRLVPDFHGDVVATDNVEGAYVATHHLIQLGHRRLAMVAGPFYLSTVQDRIRGFKTALQAFGIDVRDEWIAEEEFTWEGGYRAARGLNPGGADGPTAIFCGNDLLAIGAIRAIEAAGKSVPGDVAVVGYDGTYLADLFRPALTTVSQPAREIGEAAVRILMERLRGSRVAKRHVVLNTELRIRDTCGAKPAAPIGLLEPTATSV